MKSSPSHRYFDRDHNALTKISIIYGLDYNILCDFRIGLQTNCKYVKTTEMKSDFHRICFFFFERKQRKRLSC